MIDRLDPRSQDRLAMVSRAERDDVREVRYRDAGLPLETYAFQQGGVWDEARVATVVGAIVARNARMRLNIAPRDGLGPEMVTRVLERIARAPNPLLTQLRLRYSSRLLPAWTIDTTRGRVVAAIGANRGLRYVDMLVDGLDDLAPLGDLTNLEVLRVEDLFRVADLGFLVSMRNLTHLQLYRAHHVSAIPPLATLTGLRELVLSASQVADLSPLAGLGSLRTLDLVRSRELVDLTGLPGWCPNLTTLNLAHSAVRDGTPLAGLRKLSTLKLGGTDMADYTFLWDMPSLTDIWLWPPPPNYTDEVRRGLYPEGVN